MYLFWKTNQTGKKYYCLGENKKIDGKSVRIKEIYLGTADKLYELIYSKSDLEKINTYEYGLTTALLQSIRETGLYKILNEILPFKIRGVPASIVIIIILLNKIINPKSKNSINQWYTHSVICKILPINHGKLSGQFFFDCLQKLDQKIIHKIESKMAKMVKKVENLDSILCDMTKIETYIQEHEGNILPMRGRTGRRSINVALMITRDNSIPLFHISYPGNVNDVTEFAEVVKILEKKYNLLSGYGKKKITIMIDKGNNNEKNINGLEDAGYYFVGRLRPSSYEDLLSVPLSKFKDKYEGKQDVISYSIFKEIYGRIRKVVIKFDKKSFDKSYAEFMDLIERRKTSIKKLESKTNYALQYGTKKSKSYWSKEENLHKAVKTILTKEPTSNLFTYVLNHKKDRVFVNININQEEYDKRINLIGKYVLFTNRKKWDHNKIIKAFYDQYLIEHQYKTLKGERIKIKPLNHWTDNSIRADIFLSILSLQIMNLFLTKVRTNKIPLSNNQILDSLEQIKISYYKLKGNKHDFDLINDMNKEENLLYSKLDLKNKNTFSYIKKAF